MMITALQGLLSIPSVTGVPAVTDENGVTYPYGIATYEALNYTLAHCKAQGFRTKNCDNLLGYAEIGTGEELIGILAHLDVVPAGEGWDYPPFGGTIADGVLYGRGTLDDKGPIIAVISAMKRLLDSGRPIDKRIRLILGCQEESGEWEDIHHYKSTEELPAYGFTPDADFPAIYGEKGILSLGVEYPLEGSGLTNVSGGLAVNMVADYAKAETVTGKLVEEHGVSAHGSMPEDGVNAIAKVMEQLVDESDFAKFYMEKIGYTTDGSRISCQYSDQASGPLTFNVGTIRTENSRIVMEVDIRYPVSIQPEEIVVALEGELHPVGGSVAVQSQKNPVFLDRDSKVIQALMGAYQQVTGQMEPPIVIGGGTYARAMDNIVAFGPVFPGHPCTEHQKNEGISLEDLYAAEEIYYQALNNLLEL